MPAREVLDAAGFVLSVRSAKRPRKKTVGYVLDDGRLMGSATLHLWEGREVFTWLELGHRVQQPGRFGFERTDAVVLLMPDDYSGSRDEVVDQLDSDCRTILSALASGGVLAGVQDDRFTMLVPFADGYNRSRAGRRANEPAKGPLDAFDTEGLADIRTLAAQPYPLPNERKGPLARLLQRR